MSVLTRYNGGVAFRIRRFQKADFETVLRIDQACFDAQLAYSRAEMAFYIRRPGAFTLVAENEAGGPENKAAATGNSARDESDVATAASAVRLGMPTAAIGGSRTILGFIVAEVRRKVGHIITIDVVVEARRSGVGSALLGAAEHELRENGAEAVELETAVNNEAAIRFYKQKGYFVAKTVRGYYSNQLDALVMEKVLEAEG